MTARKIAAALGLAALMALTGCATSTDDSSGSDTEDTAETMSPEKAEAVYLMTLADEPTGVFLGVDDAMLVGIGHDICHRFDLGLLWLNAVSQTVEAGYTPGQAGYLIGTAVTAFCPENSDVLPDA